MEQMNEALYPVLPFAQKWSKPLTHLSTSYRCLFIASEHALYTATNRRTK